MEINVVFGDGNHLKPGLNLHKWVRAGVVKWAIEKTMREGGGRTEREDELEIKVTLIMHRKSDTTLTLAASSTSLFVDGVTALEPPTRAPEISITKETSPPAPIKKY